MTTFPLRAPSPAPAPERAVVIRPATLADVPAMAAVMEPFVRTGDLLPRSTDDLSRHIGEYVLAETGAGTIVGTGSLKIYSPALAEIAALAVRDDSQGQGVGRELVAQLIANARALGLAQVFGLTRRAPFFQRLGFRMAAREEFPLKVWGDCARCPRQHACDEVAVALQL
ncbi:MAG: GNAT family N-acetyltransferase [Gemmatimonadales bacterium]